MIFLFSLFQLFEDSSIGVREPGPNYIKYRYIFLLTDGLSSDVLQWGSRHSSHMCSVYVLAVGSQISSTDLYDMASTGQNSFKLVFSIHNEEAFNSFWLQEMDDGCNGTLQNILLLSCYGIVYICHTENILEPRHVKRAHRVILIKK